MGTADSIEQSYTNKKTHAYWQTKPIKEPETLKPLTCTDGSRHQLSETAFGSFVCLGQFNCDLVAAWVETDGEEDSKMARVVSTLLTGCMGLLHSAAISVFRCTHKKREFLSWRADLCLILVIPRMGGRETQRVIILFFSFVTSNCLMTNRTLLARRYKESVNIKKTQGKTRCTKFVAVSCYNATFHAFVFSFYGD